jgi:metallo-beta-lactamase family protein
MRLTFHGAAQEVTGSMHLVEADGMLIALDCGLFQGKRAEALAKNQSFPIDPAKVHAVVLSHAHVDHCGRLPLLVKQGFTGRIHATAATRDLSALLMADSAHIQAEDARFLNKKRARSGQPPIEPLYDDEDAAAALKLFNAVTHDHVFWVTKRLAARFLQTGHMLGACLIELKYAPPDGGSPITLVYTGDVGRFDLPILQDPHAIPPCDYLITESTYGGRRHPPAADLKEQLAEAICDTVRRGGKVIIPAFSVGRTQVVVYVIHQLRTERRIPEVPVFVDSPLAVNATEVFRLHPDLFDAEARGFLRQTGDILGSGCCTYIRDVEESKKLNTRRSPCVIISASGMCETGRIVHHLANNIESPKNTVLIVGFQAAHTLGRRIVEKAPHVNIFGKRLKLRARVVALNGFSGHADRDELRRLLKPLAPTCKRAFLVHGELDQMQPLRDTMREDGFRAVEIPAPGDSYELTGASRI